MDNDTIFIGKGTVLQQGGECYVVLHLKQFSHRPEQDFYEVYNEKNKEELVWNRYALLNAIKNGEVILS